MCISPVITQVILMYDYFNYTNLFILRHISLRTNIYLFIVIVDICYCHRCYMLLLLLLYVIVIVVIFII